MNEKNSIKVNVRWQGYTHHARCKERRKAYTASCAMSAEVAARRAAAKCFGRHESELVAIEQVRCQFDRPGLYVVSVKDNQPELSR